MNWEQIKTEECLAPLGIQHWGNYSAINSDNTGKCETQVQHPENWNRADAMKEHPVSFLKNFSFVIGFWGGVSSNYKNLGSNQIRLPNDINSFQSTNPNYFVWFNPVQFIFSMLKRIPKKGTVK